MEAKIKETTSEEQRRRETVAYPSRDEQDYEELLEQMEEIEGEEVADAVEEISEVLDGQLRNNVANHFQAPIRSLNNPGENTVELQGGDQAQVVGEEYSSVNGNLPDFKDIGNIKWWTVYDEGTYREERRADMQGEHLQFNSEGDLHGFRVELDGKPLDSNQVQSLARNLRIRRDSQVLDENQIPEFVLNYQNPEEIVESEDISKEEFEDSYREAEKLGLVTTDGDITLKGWLSAANMQARDLTVFEDLDKTDESVSFPNLDSEDLDSITDTEAVGKSGNIQLEFNLPSSDVTIADSVYSGTLLYSEEGYEVQGFGQLPEFLDEKGVDLIDRFYDVSVNDVFGRSGAFKANISEIQEIGNDSVIQESDSVQELLINQIGEEVTGEINYNSGDSDVIISSPSVDGSAVDFLNSNAVEIKEIDYVVDSEIDFEGPLSDKAPLDEIRETFDLGKVEKEIKDMMQSYETEVLPEDFDHPNGRPGKAVEMNLSYESFAAEYFNSSSGDPWPLKGSNTIDSVGNFYITGRNIFEFDKPDMELYPFLIDQIKDEIESQGGSVEAVNSDAVTIRNYDKLDDSAQEKLDLIEESTLRTLTEDGDKTYIDGSKLIFERLPKVKADINTSDYLEVDTEADIESRTYQKTEEIQRMAEALDPMNMQKTPYEQITFETGFEY